VVEDAGLLPIPHVGCSPRPIRATAAAAETSPRIGTTLSTFGFLPRIEVGFFLFNFEILRAKARSGPEW
jgi:hypothetical protein